jgi:hypothetical protein
MAMLITRSTINSSIKSLRHSTINPRFALQHFSVCAFVGFFRRKQPNKSVWGRRAKNVSHPFGKYFTWIARRDLMLHDSAELLLWNQSRDGVSPGMLIRDEVEGFVQGSGTSDSASLGGENVVQSDDGKKQSRKQ